MNILKALITNGGPGSGRHPQLGDVEAHKSILLKMRPGETKIIAGHKVEKSNPPKDPRFNQTPRYRVNGSDLMQHEEAAHHLAYLT